MKQALKGVISVIIVLTLSLHFSSEAKAENRLGGINRYETAVELSKEGWKSAHNVVLARGDEYADALTGTALAYKLKAPILLTQSKQLTKVTKEEIRRLGANKVTILGGETAVSKSVANELQKMGLKVTRISGKDRYETATKIATKLVYTYDFPIDWMILASGQNYADALSVSQVSSLYEHPILLTRKDKLSKATRDYIEKNSNISEIYIIGGTGAVSSGVEKELRAMKSDYPVVAEHDVIRISGKDRYETLHKIVQAFPKVVTDIPSQMNKTTHSALFVSGQNFPDALTASALASRKGEVLVTVKPKNVPSAATKLINDFTITNYQIVGGSSAISATAAIEIDQLTKNSVGKAKQYTYLTLDNIVDVTQKMMNSEKVMVDGAPFVLGGALSTNKQLLNKASWSYISRWDGVRVYEYPFGLSIFSDKERTYNDYIGFPGEDRTNITNAYEAMNLLEDKLGITFEWNGSLFSSWYYIGKNGFRMNINTIDGPDVLSITYTKR